ncbi:hypothetical protein ACFSDD_18855 [Salipiger marinus]|uniref:F0F1 ATP synthase subunit B family protein n=1 Tax=Salipiger marinus TaxID=555512 RepID=UPI002CB165C1|nr:hypothetical protein [Salipiger manganoxidans]MEB3418733.1 hypothetical protein [Salipiger manganoxidans]
MTFDVWTLGFQAVNVLVLVWLLHRLFWRPVAAMIATRQAAAATLLDEAGAKRAEAEAALAGIAATRAGLAAERDAMLDRARQDAAAARETLLAEAQAEAEALHDTAKAARIRAAATLKAHAMDEAQMLAVTIASRLVARLDGPATEAAFLGWLVQGLAALSGPERAALAAEDLELVSATEQGIPAQERIRAALATVFGAPVVFALPTDPALIAGLELHAPHFSLRNSWRADLARIAAALGETDGLSDAA